MTDQKMPPKQSTALNRTDSLVGKGLIVYTATFETLNPIMTRKFSPTRSLFFTLIGLFGLVGCTSQNKLASIDQHPPTAWVTACKDWDDWDKPGPPFRIVANSYYVGTCGISAILITGDAGHVLIDGGTEAGADVIANNIKALGFDLQDVELLLHSHEHHDHVGGLAKLQALTGGQVWASRLAAPALSTGQVAADDPQAALNGTFPPVRVDDLLQPGLPVKLGNLSLQHIATPGHTPGALSWQWQACENDQCTTVVYADSLSPVSSDVYAFSDHLGYVRAYKAGLAKLAALECQIVLAPHPSASKMRDRLASPEGLLNPQGCMNYADGVLKRLNKRLAKEQQAKQQPSN